jgi:hypothetical protein
MQVKAGGAATSAKRRAKETDSATEIVAGLARLI